MSFSFSSCLLMELVSDLMTATFLKKSSRNDPFADLSLDCPDSMSSDDEDFVRLCCEGTLVSTWTRQRKRRRKRER